jgi:2-polyprenyl-6-methoxyphenol hydroxylase-like FAD-dependent oxidoreductase
MLSPNALRILDDLGVYSRIRSKGWNFEALTFMNEGGESTGKYFFGHEKLYGYTGLRVYRQVLLEELTGMVRERNVEVCYRRKFLRVLEEGGDGVCIEFADGSTERADLVVGADGVHSTIRQYVCPATTKYTGFIGITSPMEKSKIRFPSADYPDAVSISAKPGAFLIVPQTSDGEEMFVGTQRAVPERDRAGWDALLADKKQLVALFREHYDDWPDIVKSVLENLVPEKLTIWAMYTLPRLNSWISVGKKVIIVGDAAHAISPTAGQGVNQAFEDVYALSLLLANILDDAKLNDGIKFWQSWRQERIDKLLDLTRRMNNKRLPAAEQAKLPKKEVWQDESTVKGEGEEMRWLYAPDLKEEVFSWIQKQNTM